MPCGKVARQSRGDATTGPDAKACAQAAPHIHPTTAPLNPARAAPAQAATPDAPQAGPDAPPTEAEILLGATMWLARVRDWLGEEIDLAPTAAGALPATVTLRRADTEALRDGLGRAVSLLDGLTVDPAQIRPRTDVDATPAGGRTLQ